MRSVIRTDRPADSLDLRRSIYAGDVFRLTSTAASRRVTDEVVGLLDAEFGDKLRDPETALGLGFFSRIMVLRRLIAADPRFHIHARDVAAALGFDPERTAYEPFRLRAVLHDGHTIPAAASAYTVHRDTWYAHPQCVVTVWIPLFDLSEEETFVFYPEWFDRALLPNDSEGFEFAPGASRALDRKVALEHHEANRTVADPDAAMGVTLGRELGFAGGRAETILFSGAQLHRTRPHRAGRTRFSIDCRFVALDDHQRGLGATNVDNRSRGSALDAYVYFSAPG